MSKVMNTSARAKLRSIHSRCSLNRRVLTRRSATAVAADQEMAQAAKTTLPIQPMSKRPAITSPPALVTQAAKMYVRPIARCTRGLLLSSRGATRSCTAAAIRATLPVSAWMTKRSGAARPEAAHRPGSPARNSGG